ncbi:ABC transporter related [Desulfatibacillum aliphaticivorans]|uniref:ABC transporter related n=1 Tax=Desulfatibacillum aliphaticivorans TaxID=218208 RepID=B8FK74_DESAL|nr:ABC transporter ATP-binding protein/permease [Desulfatibacillum aliphaticivorans]ACL02749.1 ABC transporter related [Desulfatibacillum aliphaticivorans]
MAENKKPIIQRSIYSWILPGNVKWHLLTVLCISITVAARVVPLEMQKRIINDAIALKKMDMLYIYCGIYLAAVLLATGMKFAINMLQTYIGQRALEGMRKGLYHHILTLPMSFFRKTPPGMVVTSLVTELVSSGDFVGTSIAIPVTNILTLAAFAVYLFILNPWLAIISLSIYPVVLFLVPLLQKKVNHANRQRVDATRDLSSKITETITGIHEIHGNGSYDIENKRYDSIIDKLFKIRIVWTLYKQAVNIVNNFFTNMSPFLIFLLGGYLAMSGRLELGALVAFLSAQEKLYDPWKELIAFYQVYQDAIVRYQKTMSYFDLMPEHEIVPEDGRKPYTLKGSIKAERLSFVTEEGIRLIDNINLDLKHGEHLALVGFSGSGKSTLAMCLAQLYKFTGGKATLDGKDIEKLTKSDMVNNVGLVSQSPFIFDGTIRENVIYSCEAAANIGGNMEDMPNLDQIINVLQQTGVFVDVLRFGLNTMVAPNQYPDLVTKLVDVRKKFKENFGDILDDYVEFFHPDRYLYHSSILDNLIFGAPNKESLTEDGLEENEYFHQFLQEADIFRPLASLGEQLANQTVDILGNMPADKVFFELSPLSPLELTEYKELLERTKKQRLHEMDAKDKWMFLKLGLRYIPGKHKMVSLPGMLENLILEGRAMFKDTIMEDDPQAVSFFQEDEYIYSQTILNNILFGKTTTSRPEVQDKINQSIIRFLVEEDLLETVVEIGMEFRVGTRGENMSGGQRQKIAIARTFLKAPPVLIMDEATSALDNKSQTRIQNQIDRRWKGKSTLIAVVHRLDITVNYDKIAVMKAGNIVEMGTYQELMDKKGMLYELAHGRQDS